MSLKKIKQYIKHGFIYTGVKYFVTLIGFIKSILIAKYLGPTLLGSYAYIMLLVEYLTYCNFGVYASMNREASIYKDDKEKENYVQQILNISLTFSLLITFPILLIFLGLDKLPSGFISDDIFQYRYHIFSLIFLNQLRGFTLRYFRLYERFYLLSIFELVSNTIMLFGIIFFVNKYYLDAAVVFAIIGNTVIVIIGLANLKNVKLYINKSILKYLILAGIPMVLYALSDKLFTTIDRAMIAHFLPRSDLGYYQFGNTLAVSTILIFYPKFLKSFHYKTEKEQVLRKKTLLNTIYYMEFFSTLLVVIGIIIIPLFISFLMPQYFKSILLVKILLIAFSFKPIIFLTSSFLVANDNQSKLLPTTLIALIILAAMNYIVIYSGHGINGLVIVTAIAFGIYCLALYILIFRKIESLISIWRQYLFLFLGVLIIIAKIPLYFILILWLILYYTRITNVVKVIKANII